MILVVQQHCVQATDCSQLLVLEQEIARLVEELEASGGVADPVSYTGPQTILCFL